MNAVVVGSGAWGTALALCLHRNGHHVKLWCHAAARAAEINETRINPRLAQHPLPQEMEITAGPACVADCRLVVIAVPSYAIRSTCRIIAPFLPKDATVVSVTKGIEPGSLLRMSQVITEETGHCVVALTGPSHAEEVAEGIPTGCLAACADREKAEFVQDAFMSSAFRIYTSPDIIGAELGGALKNIIALCAGVCDGLGYGDNTQAMLMTRGLTEIARLGLTMGAQKDTFAGLAGVGDLIVTCTSRHSRNRRAGVLIGQGQSPKEAMDSVGAVVEGYYAAASAWELKTHQGVEMPIVQAAYDVLYRGVPANVAVQALLVRQKKAEAEDAVWH